MSWAAPTVAMAVVTAVVVVCLLARAIEPEDAVGLEDWDEDEDGREKDR